MFTSNSICLALGLSLINEPGGNPLSRFSQSRRQDHMTRLTEKAPHSRAKDKAEERGSNATLQDKGDGILCNGVLTLPYLALPYIALLCFASPCLALPCPTLLCLALLYLTSPRLALPCLALACLPLPCSAFVPCALWLVPCALCLACIVP